MHTHTHTLTPLLLLLNVVDVVLRSSYDYTSAWCDFFSHICDDDDDDDNDDPHTGAAYIYMYRSFVKNIWIEGFHRIITELG